MYNPDSGNQIQDCQKTFPSNTAFQYNKVARDQLTYVMCSYCTPVISSANVAFDTQKHTLDFNFEFKA